MPDDDDRPRDASSAADASWGEVVIPDDISSLGRDIEAYRRELRQARRHARIQRWLDRRGALPLAIVAFAVVIAGLVASLLTVLAPHAVSSPPRALPLATPKAVPGDVGGLLPIDSLRGPDGTTAARSIRPAALVLVPTHCGDCSPLISQLAGQAYSVGLHLSVVVPAAADSDAAALPEETPAAKVDVYYDRSGKIARTFRASGVTAVLVNKDGTVYDRLSVSPNNVTQLQPLLQYLLVKTPSQG